jgi:trimethylamine:corrinoid methyltransferase-like protein
MEPKVLRALQIARVHGASMGVLERVGVVVPHEDMLDRLEQAGAKVAGPVCFFARY